jgi:hypothetical protein
MRALQEMVHPCSNCIVPKEEPVQSGRFLEVLGYPGGLRNTIQDGIFNVSVWQHTTHWLQ